MAARSAKSPLPKSPARARPIGAAGSLQRPLKARVEAILKSLERAGSKRVLEEMGPRYGIVTKKAFGVPMAKIKAIAKPLGADHDLALALWETGWYEARLLCSMIDDPAQVTPAQMDRWAKDFDNWGVCDTLCFNLFDRSPHAFAKVDQWAKRKGEFEKRAAFALLACLALHDKSAPDEAFLKRLPLIEAAANDERNFVKKGVNWALRAIGGRKSVKLKAQALALAQRLAGSKDATARWNGKDAMRQLARRAGLASAKKSATATKEK